MAIGTSLLIGLVGELDKSEIEMNTWKKMDASDAVNEATEWMHGRSDRIMRKMNERMNA